MFFFDEACWYAERDDAPKGHAWMPLTSDRAAALCAFVSSRRLGLPAEALPAWAHELYLRGGAAPAVPLTAAQRRKEHAQEVRRTGSTSSSSWSGACPAASGRPTSSWTASGKPSNCGDSTRTSTAVIDVFRLFFQ